MLAEPSDHVASLADYIEAPPRAEKPKEEKTEKTQELNAEAQGGKDAKPAKAAEIEKPAKVEAEVEEFFTFDDGEKMPIGNLTKKQLLQINKQVSEKQRFQSRADMLTRENQELRKKGTGSGEREAGEETPAAAAASTELTQEQVDNAWAEAEELNTMPAFRAAQTLQSKFDRQELSKTLKPALSEEDQSALDAVKEARQLAHIAPEWINEAEAYGYRLIRAGNDLPTKVPPEAAAQQMILFSRDFAAIAREMGLEANSLDDLDPESYAGLWPLAYKLAAETQVSKPTGKPETEPERVSSGAPPPPPAKPAVKQPPQRKPALATAAPKTGAYRSGAPQNWEEEKPEVTLASYL
jgi:hypothetical protein